MSNVLIIGPPGIGKSTVGEELRGLGEHFIDIDLENLENPGIIANSRGEPLSEATIPNDPGMRDFGWSPDVMATVMERESQRGHTVVRLGGIAANFNDPAIIGLFDDVAYLRGRPDTIQERLAKPDRKTPFDMLAGHPERVERLLRALPVIDDMAERVATHIIDTDGLSALQVARRILLIGRQP